MNSVKSLAPLLLGLVSACASSADPHSDETGTADDVSGSDGGSELAGSENSSTAAGSDGSSSSGGASNGSTSGTGGPTRTTASSSGGTNTGTASSAGGSGGTEAIGGAGGSAGADDSDDGTSAAGAAGDNDDGELEPGRIEAMAITRARLEELREEEEEAGTSAGTGSATGGTPSDLDPNDLFLRFSDLGVLCTEAFRPLPCGSHWFVSIVLPPEYQAVGVYDLSDPAVSSYSYRSETGEARPGSDGCSWGGGSLGGGTLEVLAIDDNEVRFQVELSGSVWDTDPDGEYTAVRCD